MSEILQPTNFTVRLVIVDYYLSAPIPELDVSLSEFRGADIKQIPVLRIFGSNNYGQKVCLHVHGIFPYLYIPCDETNPEPKLLYQIANSIDKAINISLKQANAHTQHVYKVTLVKGIPYYGYHHKEHQFFKIFFYNPSFVKRAGDLLQSGAIMGISFQPHESHINYVMQFLMDFNLYGMSFIHLEHVKFRRKTSNSQLKNYEVNEELYLPDSIPYTSTCECEADCLAQHILNRQDSSSENFGVNPGLEALWIDEKKRQRNLELSSEILPSPSQIRDDIPVTDSHHYHNKRLIVKIALYSELNNENNDTEINLSILNDTDQNKLSGTVLSNKSIYPAEVPNENDCTIATDVTIHHPMAILKKYNTKTTDNCESLVCEDIVNQYSQKINPSPIEFDNEDIELIGMLQDLEHKIEDDSILGTQIKDEPDIDTYKEDTSEYTENFDNVDLVIPNNNDLSDNTTNDDFVDTSPKTLQWNDSYWDGVENFSQLDGTWDEEDKKRKSIKKNSLRIGLSRKCKRSLIVNSDDESHTNNKKNKIEVVDECTITNNPDTDKKIEKDIVNLDEKFKIFGNSPKNSPKKCTPKNSPNKTKYKNSPNRKSCRNSPSKLLTNYEPLSIKIEHSPIASKSLQRHSTLTATNDTLCTPKRKIKKYPKDLIQNSFVTDSGSDSEILCIKNKSAKNTNSTDDIEDMEDIFKNDLNKIKTVKTFEKDAEKSFINKLMKDRLLEKSAKKIRAISSSQYDRINNYIPQPGTSSKDNKNISLHNNDLEMVSFYDKSICFDDSVEERSPIISEKIISTGSTCSDFHLQYPDKSLETLNTKSDINKSISNPQLILNKTLYNIKCGVTLIPKNLPPSRNDIISTMNIYNIPSCVNMVPFYSNYKDAGNQIEVGNIILKLKSKNLDQIKDFPTSIAENIGLNQWREKLFLENNLSQDCTKTKNLDLVLSSKRRIVLVPILIPPTTNAVKKWLISYKTKKDKISNDNENKIEPVTEKIKICMPCSPGEEINESQNDTLSISSCSLTPATPECHKKILRNLDNKNNHLRKFSAILTPNKIEGKKQYTPRACRRSLRLSQHTVPIKNTDTFLCDSVKSSQGSDESDIVCGQSIVLSSQDKESYLEVIPEMDEGNLNTTPSTIEKTKNNTDATYKSPMNLSEGYFNNTNGFKFSGENYQNAAVCHENEYLTIVALEVLTVTRGDYNPNPEIDPICAVFYSILNDCPENHTLPQKETGVIAIDEDFNNVEKKWLNFYPEIALKNFKFTTVENERSIFDQILILIKKWDPDILCGFEIEMSSWGYLFQRGFLLEINMADGISRIKMTNKHKDYKSIQQQLNKEFKLIGRITLDVWRLLRHEIALTSYSFESIYYHVMHERLPSYSYKTLSFWWRHPSKLLKSLTMEYFLTRVTGIIRILLQLDLIGRTSELARLFGIQWYEVLSRGSQFRVESMMIRLTRPLNYVLVSPAVQQRAAMKAPECLPLILEPESRFYGDPVIVLDFQSLYPSMIIAYNYCYSTCIGNVENMGKNTPYQFGATHLRISPEFLKKLCEKNLINWSPCGVGFVKPAVRKGILPAMLDNILSTRFMVKKSMKKHKSNKTLQKILHNRQLGLKLIANVTYGYTAANFSGRMPCVEVGDSVVSKGRETLERAIRTVENTKRWNAKVVYGDTDSLFILVAGRSRSEAFDIGAEIAEVVTNDNPTPVKLKFEKVYHPCILQTKKRYVGYMYESKDQTTPEYDAKGIETVRRDGCPAVSKILEKTLRILFETYDVSKVKSFICRKFQNIIEGKCNIQDFVFAREFRGMNAYKPTASVPALEIARRYKSLDVRKEPREGQRVPYIIINGEPGQSLLQSARCPRELLTDTSLRINVIYYITRVIIPPLNRCLTLLGADVKQWFDEMPRKQNQLYPIIKINENQTDTKKNTISQYFSKVNCVGCNIQTVNGICEECLSKPRETFLTLQNKMNEWQRNYNAIIKICQSCCGRSTHLNCVSIDCSILFHLSVSKQNLEQLPFFKQMEKKLLDF